jgi:predicted porin
MKTFAATAIMLLMLFPIAARAQEPASAQQNALLRLVEEQMRRIEALEARLAQLQQKVESIGGPQAVAAVVDDEEMPVEHAFDGAPPDDPDQEAPAADLPRALNVDAYGSLRVLTATDTDGHAEVRNNASRIGIRGEKELFRSIMAFGRYEMGLNMVTNDRVILLTSGDPGTPIGQGSQAITSRLGYVGLGTPVGNFSWGKQWSPFYDVAQFSDQLQVFTGLATGAFGAGTDGGIAGTGRAEQAVQYRHSWGPFSGGLQAQNRSLTANDRQWADTFGGAFVVSGENGFGVGAAYNQVRDGVASPTINEPQLGDKATIFGVRFRHERFYAGSTYSILKQHEIDDLGRRFDGNGFEIALRHYLLEHVWLEGVYNDLRPNDDHPGDFRIRFGAANVVYNFSTASRVFAGFKFEGSRKSDGSDLQTSTFAAGLNYTF